jgi:dGTP triphosphohydrolase
MSNPMPKKKIRKNTKLIRYNQYGQILQESLQALKDRIEGMPVNMLLMEHQTLSEYYGTLQKKNEDWFTGPTRDVFDKMMAVRDRIMHIVHSLQDHLLMAEYQTEEAYRLMEKKEKNVEVSKNTNK